MLADRGYEDRAHPFVECRRAFREPASFLMVRKSHVVNPQPVLMITTNEAREAHEEILTAVRRFGSEGKMWMRCGF